MKLLYVYILECSDKSYYTGVTNDSDRRVIEHQTGYDRDSYTCLRRPVKCVWVSEPLEPLNAIALEKQIKGWSRKKKEAVITGLWNLLPGLSKSKSRKDEADG